MEHQQRIKEMEGDTLSTISQSKGKTLEAKHRQKDAGMEDDVDHALGASLRAISIRSGKRGNAREEDDLTKDSKLVQIEWDEELEEMSREKASSEARSGTNVS